jgi:uncharacterized RDD family membrane protein YckC
MNGERDAVVIHPWRRYFARSIDYSVAGAVLGALIGFFNPSFYRNQAAGILLAMLAMALWVPLEALLVARYGTTPGKAFMNLRVTPADSDEPARFDAALGRALRVWFGGVACGAPLLSFVAMVIGYESLRRRGAMWWDRQLEFTVQAIGPLSWARIGGLILFFGVLVALAVTA